MVPAAYGDGVAVQVCDLASDRDGVSAKFVTVLAVMSDGSYF